jgi:hypothetical protein
VYQSVIDAFPSFSKKLEGYVNVMYVDVKQLVTTGVGVLIEPISQALRINWIHRDTKLPASRDEIISEWNMIKDDKSLAHLGHKAAEKIATLMLTDVTIDALVLEKLELNDAYIKKAFVNWNKFPASAQLVIHSMAWALGAGFEHTWKDFTHCCESFDWVGASEQCHINETNNAGVIPRNVINKKLLLAIKPDDDPSQIHGL